MGWSKSHKGYLYPHFTQPYGVHLSSSGLTIICGDPRRVIFVFLGLGIQLSTFSLRLIVVEKRNIIVLSPWGSVFQVLVFPGLAI